jgi:hypothetical protein
VDDVLEAEPEVQFEGSGAGAAVVVLVDGEESPGHAGIARGLGTIFVTGYQPLTAIDHHDDSQHRPMPKSEPPCSITSACSGSSLAPKQTAACPSTRIGIPPT